MGYSSFKRLKIVTEKFGLSIQKQVLFGEIQPVPPSDWLSYTIQLAYLSPLSNEKAKSERLISPILTEVHRFHKDKISLFSGAELNVHPQENLNGPCDFFFSAVPNAYLLEAPVVAFTEAKNEDMEHGLAQCTAQMVAAQRFNEKAGKPTKRVWGCATTAGEWQFMVLEDKTLSIDANAYYIDRIDNLLGVFHIIISSI